MILAVASLLGGLLWFLTKDSIPLRWLCLALVVALKAVSYHPWGEPDGRLHGDRICRRSGPNAHWSDVAA